MEAARNQESKKETKGKRGYYMSAVEYFEFKGVKYGIGTVVKVPQDTDIRWIPKEKLVAEAVFVGGGYFKFTQYGNSIFLSKSLGHFSGQYEEYIEIISPVYYQDPEQPGSQNIFFRTNSGTWDAHNEVCLGFVWYIAIMLLTVLFKERILLWVLETIIYFCWKSKK